MLAALSRQGSFSPGDGMGIFVDMHRMVAKDFETGLANLKALAER